MTAAALICKSVHIISISCSRSIVIGFSVIKELKLAETSWFKSRRIKCSLRRAPIHVGSRTSMCVGTAHLIRLFVFSLGKDCLRQRYSIEWWPIEYSNIRSKGWPNIRISTSLFVDIPTCNTSIYTCITLSNTYTMMCSCAHKSNWKIDNFPFLKCT